MKASDNTPTGALYAFLNMYYKFYEETKPDYICVCFDLKAPTFRHEKFDAYKATRKPMPDDLAVQMPILKEILDSLGIARVELEGFEADDLIGSIATYSGNLGWKTYILTGDKDDLQLVNDNTIVVMPISQNGQTSTFYYDADAVEAKYMITPSQFIDFKAIMGDPSDNIPGVKGIGEKGATELLVKYKTLDNIYNSIDEIPVKIAEKLRASKEIAYLSHFLATIKCDIPVEEYFKVITDKIPDWDEAYHIFNRLGFKTFIRKLELTVPVKQNADETVTIDEEWLNKQIRDVTYKEFIAALQSAELYKFNQESLQQSLKIYEDHFTKEFIQGLNFEDNGFISLINESDDSVLIDFNGEYYARINIGIIKDVFDFFRESKIRTVCNEIKEILCKNRIDTYNLLVFDISVAAHLLNQIEGKPSIERIAEICLGSQYLHKENEVAAPEITQQSLFDVNPSLQDDNNNTLKQQLMDTAKHLLSILNKIAAFQLLLLEQRNLLFLAIYVEMPLVGILAEMEFEGFKVDVDVLNQLNESFQKRIEDLDREIHLQAGTDFNINSPKQLADVLFNRLKLPTGKKSQTGFSTNSDVLVMLSDKHPIIKLIIAYRQLSKLKSTFIEGLIKSIDPTDNRVHTTFNQTLTATGRLSSTNPNLQNIPIRQEDGREIRKAFVSKDGYTLVDADYSQIELRLLAAFSGDEQMVTAFINNDDIHMNTALEIFDLPRELITPSMRSIAKTINFSIVYGIGEFSLSADLGISMKDAKTYIEEYHKKYPGVKPYLKSLVQQAYEKGYVETLFHRRRYMNELKSANKNIRSFGERAAMNTPLQGTAADIIKIAMVLVHRRLRQENCQAKLILQVHDELILEVKQEESSKASEILKQSMENSVLLSVPLIAEIKTKDVWFDY